MTRYRSLRRANTKGKLDRGTWAGLDKLKFQTLVRGGGEAYVGPIYFGQAFESPPFFTYSAVANLLDNPHPAVHNVGFPSRHAGTGGAKTDELVRQGWISDGSFEHQMIWNDSYIPDVTEHNTWPGFQKIEDDRLGSGVGFDLSNMANAWIQSTPEASPSQPRWIISNDRAYVGGPGYRGKYSARYVFGSEAASRWLIPIRVYASVNPWTGYSATDPVEWHLNDVISWTGQTARPGNLSGGYRPIAFNPPLGTFTISCKVWVTDAMTFEAVVKQWDDYDDEYWGVQYVYYKLYKEDNNTQELIPGEWNDVTFQVTHVPELWPNYPMVADSARDYMFYALYMRVVGGSSGDKAYIDDVQVSANYQTAGGGIPMLTIGVAEWIQDQGGMYVGANLWIKAEDGSAAGTISGAGGTGTRLPPTDGHTPPPDPTIPPPDVIDPPQDLELRFGAAANIDYPPPATSLDDSFQELMWGGRSNSGSGTGQLKTRRTFRSGDGMVPWDSGPWKTDVTRHNVEVSWVSFHGNHTTNGMTDGTYDAGILSFINSVPAGHQVWMTFHHEPENDGVNAADWRAAQKYFHTYVSNNKGSKDIKVAPILMAVTLDPLGGRTLSDWIPLHSAGVPAFDFFGFDMYDFDTQGQWKKHWAPVSGGNQLGVTGFLDRVVTTIGGSFTRSNLAWACAELGTKKTGTAAASWFGELVEGAEADTAECYGYTWFHNDHTGHGAPWNMPDAIQDWIKASN